jgi:NADH-quinone oxidoreductase subunit J
VYSALYFLLVIVASAALLVLLQAEFLAVALIIIYAGAILVTYLFVIMLAQQPGLPIYDRRAREPFTAVFASFVLTAAIAGRAADLPQPTKATPTQLAGASPKVILTQQTSGERQPLGEGGSAVAASADEAAPTGASPRGNSLAVGEAIMTKQVVTLQVAGILLLISMVGAIAMSRRRGESEAWQPPRQPLGQVGREVKPF